MLTSRENWIHCPASWHYRWPSPSVKIKTPIFVVAAICIIFVIIVIYYYASHLSNFEFGMSHKYLHQRNKPGSLQPTDVDNANLHYGIVIDAGSSGSRVFVYYWPTHEGNPKDLLKIDQVVDADFQLVVKKVNPGLSSFADHPQDVGKYLHPMLAYAGENIPKSKHRETPVYVLATAGMRMISKSAQKNIMDNVRLEIKMNFNFLFSDTHVEVISGKQEGVYAWIATNYVLGRFNHEGETHDLAHHQKSNHIRKKTVGIIDMGGGSVQIAFEIPKSVGSDQTNVNNNLMADFNLGCKTYDDDHNYRVYVTTFLGYGANAARVRYEHLIMNQTIHSGLTVLENKTQIIVGSTRYSPLVDPCLPIDMEMDSFYQNRQFFFKGSGDFRSCQERVQQMLNKTIMCKEAPCSMNGIYQPTFDFNSTEFYGFSEYFYTMDDLLRVAGNYNYVKFLKAAKDYCATRWSVLEHWYKKQLFPKATLRRFKYQCFKSAWIVEVLHSGFNFPRDFGNFQSVQLINGKEVQWTLGALLFRTRYFPLREVQQQVFQHAKVSGKTKPLFANQYLLLVCFVAVVVASLLYLHRLQRLHITPRPMSRVSSSSKLVEIPTDYTDRSTIVGVNTFS